ncbi:MAG: PEGA domain-containing protein [Vicinamibacterales bacterium]|nr:PEGA domain-containing protein [Vicinamibacterales bacterium]
MNDRKREPTIALEPLASSVTRDGRRPAAPRTSDWSCATTGGVIPSRVETGPRNPQLRALLLLLMLVLLTSIAIWTPAGLQTVAADTIGRLLATDTATSRTAPGPAPLVGQLDVTSAPSGIKLYVDGEQQGVTPAHLVLRAGRHELTFVSPIGQVQRHVRIRPGRRTLFSEAIFPGSLAVSSEVELEVRVDGRAIGTSDDGELPLAPGSYQVDLVNPIDGVRKTSTVEIFPGQVTSLDSDGDEMNGN